MSTELIYEIKDAKMKKLYEALWSGSEVVKTADIVKSEAGIDKKTGKMRLSDNSLSFNGNDKAGTLIKVFNIQNGKLFREKFDMACGGNGQEERRITTLHSSSLCALLHFYNVTEKNPLIIEGIGTFTESVFEFKSPVLDPRYPSNMDVVLIGKDEKGNDTVLFLESKFSEYYSSASNKLEGISAGYASNEFSKTFYSSEFLGSINTRITGKKETVSLESDEAYYIDGIKQMISHYVGIRNDINIGYEELCNIQEKKAGIKGTYSRVISSVTEGAGIVLAEIIFDAAIGDFRIKNSKKTCMEVYSEKYSLLAKAMNGEIRKAGLDHRFKVLETVLKYSMFSTGEIKAGEFNDAVRKFYAGGNNIEDGM